MEQKVSHQLAVYLRNFASLTVLVFINQYKYKHKSMNYFSCVSVTFISCALQLMHSQTGHVSQQHTAKPLNPCMIKVKHMQ